MSAVCAKPQTDHAVCWFCESSMPMRFLKRVGRRFQCVSDDACERRYNAMLKAKQS